MFLTPQHFQTLAQSFDDAVQFRFAASHFANWGLTSLDIDAEALTNKTFRLNGCTGIFNDGETINIPDSDLVPASRSLAEHFNPSRESLDVYLCLPDARPQARNITIPDPQASTGMPETRYLAETRMVMDETTGDEEKPVQVARRTFRLLFGGEYRDGFSCVRIAQIVRNAAGVPMLNSQFVPPCLDFASSPYLMMILRRQIEILANKSAALSAPRRARGKLVAEFSASETAHFWLLHTVNSFLPELKHIWSVRHGHPEAAYVAMLRLAGALSTFSLEGRPETLPDYDHEDLGRCFTLLDQRILSLLETVIPQKFVSIALQASDRFLWTGRIAEEQYLRDSQFYLAVSAKMGVDDLIRKVPQLLKISSTEEVQRLVRNALPGLALRHVPAPPDAIPVRLENQYFLLNQGGLLWDAIARSRQIAVFAPGEIVDPKMEIVIVLGS